MEELILKAMGQKTHDYLILKNKFHSVEVSIIDGFHYTDGESFIQHSSLLDAVTFALKELAVYERGRGD